MAEMLNMRANLGKKKGKGKKRLGKKKKKPLP